MAKEKIITALDIGTTKICCLIAKIDTNNKIKICGIGENRSEGLAQGMITNIQTASKSVDTAINQAEKMSGINAENVFVGVAGELIRSFDSQGIAKIERSRKYSYEISKLDVEKVIEDAKSVTPLPVDRKIIHAEPQFFTIDKKTKILNPIGMSGFRLKADVHIVTADVNSLMNLYKIMQLLCLNIKDVVLQPIASSIAVLNDDERKLGAILVDIGGGTTDVSIYYEKSIRYSCIIPFGGEKITRDLTVGLRTPSKNAEEIKIKYGFAIQDDADENKVITIQGIGGHKDSKRTERFVAALINPRMKEIAKLVLDEVKKSKYLDMMTAGISISGGAANLRSTNKLFEKMFNLPTKTGYPYFNGIYGEIDNLNDPKYATVIGLLYWGKTNFDIEPFSNEFNNSLFERLFGRMKKWFASKNFT